MNNKTNWYAAASVKEGNAAMESRSRFWDRFLAMLVLGLVSCSNNSNEQRTFSSKNLALRVTESRSFNPNILHGEIRFYRLMVTAPDLENALTQEFAGAAESGKMLGIPSGTDRTIVVEAVNPNGLVIRRGKKEGVVILPNQFSSVEIVMESVPIFANVANKSAVSENRLGLQIFAEPGTFLEVLEADASGTKKKWTVVKDSVTGKALVNVESGDGLSYFWPPQIPNGVHQFMVRDQDTRESSEVTLTLSEKTTRPGLGINNGGQVWSTGKEMVISGMGQPYYRQVSSSADHLGEATFLDIVDLFY